MEFSPLFLDPDELAGSPRRGEVVIFVDQMDAGLRWPLIEEVLELYIFFFITPFSITVKFVEIMV